MSPETRVLKFGGSSVAEPTVMRRAAMVATAALSRDGRPGSGPGVVVVSALGGVTRELLRVAEDALRGDVGQALERTGEIEQRHRAFLRDLELSAEERAEVEAILVRRFQALRDEASGPRDAKGSDGAGPFTDAILAFGELLASRFFWAELRNLGVPCDWIDARRFLRTDACFGMAAPDADRTRDLVRDVVLPVLNDGRSVVVPGFIGATEDGRSTTMGFEASDLTATLLGSVLGAREVQIWTDVSGVLSADPRVVEEAGPLPHLSYETARELAFLGARVLHPDTMRPARAAGISIRVANSRRPGDAGTTIDANDPAGAAAAGVVVASRREQSVLRLPVSSELARPVLAFLREVATRTGPKDVLFAVGAVGEERGVTGDSATDSAVIAISGDAAGLARLAESASRFGEGSVHAGWSTVSIVGCRGERPAWPVTGLDALQWEGLPRSVGALVPDTESDSTVRRVHASVHTMMSSPSHAGSGATS